MPKSPGHRSRPRGASRAPLVLVTGASQGLGEALALAYAGRHRGVRLALVARNADNLERVAVRCEKFGATAHGFVCDVTDESAVSRLPAAVAKRFRGATPDIVVNNAGRFAPATLADTPPALFDEMVSVNLRSAYLVTRAFLPALTARRSGDFVFVSSICGKIGLPGCAAYTAAKHGLTGLAAALRAETKGSVRVIAIHPGAIDTPVWENSPVPREKLMGAAGVAEAVVALTALPADTVVEDILLRPGPGDL